MSMLSVMTATMFALFDGWGTWLSDFWELNIDRWISAGWVLCAVLTIAAVLGMILRILKSTKELHP